MSTITDLRDLFLADVGRVISGEVEVTEFRRSVITTIAKRYSASIPCATTGYNTVLGMYLRDHPEHRELLYTQETVD